MNLSTRYEMTKEHKLKSHQYIYRIFDEDCFVKLLKGNLSLSLPSTWTDPYEKFFSTLINENKNIYAQCWTTEYYSDALWKSYSKQNRGVRVKTTIEKIERSIPDQYRRAYFLKKVIYLNPKDFHNTIQEYKDNPNRALDLLFIKRSAFKYEKEVRLAINTSNNLSQEYLNFKIDPKDIIQEVLLDPELKDTDYDKYKRKIEKLGYDGKIAQSQLYKLAKKYR